MGSRRRTHFDRIRVGSYQRRGLCGGKGWPSMLTALVSRRAGQNAVQRSEPDRRRKGVQSQHSPPGSRDRDRLRMSMTEYTEPVETDDGLFASAQFLIARFGITRSESHRLDSWVTSFAPHPTARSRVQSKRVRVGRSYHVGRPANGDRDGF